MKSKNPITASIKVPSRLLQDLALRAQENGRTLEVELELRVAQSLERDLQMIEEDNECAFRAFAVAQQMRNQGNQP